MSERVRRFADFFKELGAADIGHSENTYLAHACGVYRDLKSWGCSQELCDVGMFHSIYGTELFQGFTLPLERRGEVRDLIGERAERLDLSQLLPAAEFPGRERRSGNRAPYPLTDRFRQQEIELSQGGLRRPVPTPPVRLAGAGGAGSSLESSAARLSGRMAERLGGVALESYDRVFAMEPAEQPELTC